MDWSTFFTFFAQTMIIAFSISLLVSLAVATFRPLRREPGDRRRLSTKEENQ